MNSFGVFFSCFTSLFLISLATAEAAGAHRARNNGVYIVYTGAAASSSTGFPSAHILSPTNMESWRDRVIHRYENAFSGFAARLTEEEARSIAQRPEVVSVFPDPLLRLHTTRSWDFLRKRSEFKPPFPDPFLRLPTTRSLRELSEFEPHRFPKSNSSLSGEDVIIGIIDSGIWPEAKSFNDQGMSPIPNRWKGKCMTGPDFKSSNCNRKLIGARNYISDDNSTSARDHDGHGTHVAAIAAGRAVPGASYLGLALGTAQGGSPGSRIAVYRACTDFSCDGSAVLKAFDDAIADGVDIISISVGYLVDDINPITIGSFHAVEKGIMVVGAAGDAGLDEEPFGQKIDNTQLWMLTVGATTIDRSFRTDVVLGNNQVIKGGGVHSAKSSVIHPLIDGISAKIPGASDDFASNCHREGLDAEKVKGKIVLCDYTDEEDYSIYSKLRDVTSLGGMGVLFYDRWGQSMDIFSGSTPLVAIDPEDAKKIQSYINTTRNPVATILPTVTVDNYKPAPSVATFSGEGPLDENSYLLKPDIVAPGVGILSAWPSNETDEAFNILSGTSMACPHVSAVAAMVKSRYPSWTPSAIKSAIITTANPNNNLKKPITDTLGYRIFPDRSGAGEVDLFGPLQPGLVYETEFKDYLTYYCYNGYNESQIRLLSPRIPANFSCPTPSSQEMISSINYPSIAVRLSSGGDRQTVTRTVTNVGDEESVYRVSFEKFNADRLKIQVRPTELKFTKNDRKRSYNVTFINGGGGAYGSITWSNVKYRVRIPFIAY